MEQTTIEKTVSCKGIGLHSGEPSYLEFRPAKENSGIYFILNSKKISAIVENVISTNRGTTLSNIQTVEHMLAAIYGCGIDNIEIFLEGIEPPAMDGSAKPFVELLKSAGIRNLAAEKNVLYVDTYIKIEDNDAYIEISPYPHLIIETFIDYSHTIAGKVRAVYDETINNFEKEIAPARTFGLLEEVEQLKKLGLAKGATFENAIAITRDGFSTQLRFPNELARHKILDIIGDIALTGKKVVGKIVSHKAGHKLNIELARRLSNG